jgi:hypothetical protein
MRGMAVKSGGSIPGPQTIIDANQAVAILDSFHHWGVTRVNGEGRRGYSLTITHAGKRVTASRRTFVDAAIAAVAKLSRPQETSFMRLAR